MKQEHIEKVVEITRQTVIKWCKDTFEGQMVNVLANSCKVVAAHQLVEHINTAEDLKEIEKIAKEEVMKAVKDYINNTF